MNSIRAIVFFCLFCLPFTVSAAWYQVEVIIFDYLYPESDGEIWYENPGLPDRSESIELISELADPEPEEGSDGQNSALDIELKKNKQDLQAYLELPSDRLKLAGVERVLKLSSDYRPLMHTAWQQPGLSARTARPVHLQKYEETVEISDVEPESIESLIDNGGQSDEFYQAPELIFDGTLRIRSSKFLHVDIDFAYFPESLSMARENQSADSRLFVAQQADYVRLSESRKIRLNEINYFDHPLFGVILRVSRLRKP